MQEVPLQFSWHAGMAPSQKKKNIKALHEVAARRGFSPLLEVSSKSERDIGQQLSAFYLTLKFDGRDLSVESAYQGSKVFEHGGPYVDLYRVSSREAKRDSRIRESGHIVGFHFGGDEFPVSPATAFYDWLYINALNQHTELKQELLSYVGFTDIEFNPERSVNCQARSCALFVALDRRSAVEDALESFSAFISLSKALSI